jgi:hypothetical protein
MLHIHTFFLSFLLSIFNFVFSHSTASPTPALNNNCYCNGIVRLEGSFTLLILGFLVMIKPTTSFIDESARDQVSQFSRLFSSAHYFTALVQSKTLN